MSIKARCPACGKPRGRQAKCAVCGKMAWMRDKRQRLCGAKACRLFVRNEAQRAKRGYLPGSRVRQCTECGKDFEVSWKHWRTLTCGDACYGTRRRRLSRQYEATKRAKPAKPAKPPEPELAPPIDARRWRLGKGYGKSKVALI